MCLTWYNFLIEFWLVTTVHQSYIKFVLKISAFFGWFQNVDELLLGLASMGFEFEDCQLALEAGKDTLESAVEWYNYVLYTVISQPVIEP